MKPGYLTMAEKQPHMPIFDCGGEFLSNKFAQHFKQRGTQRELTVHNSPPQNSEATRTLVIASGLPHYLWAKAMAYGCWILNQMPTCALDGKTPYKMATGRKLNLTGIQHFGTAADVKLKNARKLNKRASKGHFIGYDSE